MNPQYLIILSESDGLRPGIYQVASDREQCTADPGTVLVIHHGYEALLGVPVQDRNVVPVTDGLIDMLPSLVATSMDEDHVRWPEYVIATDTVQSALFDTTIPRGVYQSAHKTHPFERDAGLLYIWAPTESGLFCLSLWSPAVVPVDDVLIGALRRMADAGALPCWPLDDGRLSVGE
jgi:hypothetical protein